MATNCNIFLWALDHHWFILVGNVVININFDVGLLLHLYPYRFYPYVRIFVGCFNGPILFACFLWIGLSPMATSLPVSIPIWFSLDVMRNSTIIPITHATMHV